MEIEICEDVYVFGLKHFFFKLSVGNVR